MKKIVHFSKPFGNLYNLKKDFYSDMETRDVYYDTGYMVSLCVSIGKKKLGQKIMLTG